MGRAGRNVRAFVHAAAALLAAPAALAAPEPAGEAAYGSTYRPLAAQDFAIVGARLLDGIGGKLDDATLIVRDGRIAAVVAGRADTGDLAVVDAAGRWVTPGIIDVHSHNGTFVAPLTANDSEYSDVSEISGPNAAGTWIEHAVNVQDPAFALALAGGVTTLQVMPGSIPLLAGRSVVLKPVPATGVRQMKFPAVAQGAKMTCGDNPRSYFGGRGGAPNSRMGSVEILRELFAKTRKQMAAGGAPADDMEAQTIAGMLRGELPVHVHCYRADDIAVVMSLAREFGFAIRAIHHATEAYKAPELFRESGTCAVVWADWWGFKTEAADGVRANAAIVDAAGACVALHSDSPAMGQRLNLEAAKAMAAGRRAGLAVPPERAIRWITGNAAKVLGLDDRIGSLEVGKNADLVLWSGDPFSVYSKPDQVFIDGALAFDRADPAKAPTSDFWLGRPGAPQR